MCLLELRFGRGNANASMAEQCETWERNGSNPRSNHNMPQYATICHNNLPSFLLFPTNILPVFQLDAQCYYIIYIIYCCLQHSAMGSQPRCGFLMELRFIRFTLVMSSLLHFSD